MFACIYIHDFPLQALLRLEPDLKSQPVALVDAVGAKSLIITRNELAAQAGVLVGQTSSQAGGRCGSLVLKNRSAAAEMSAAEILLQTAYAFSPAIESTAPGVCLLELAGLGLQSESTAKSWAGKIIATLAGFHLDAKIGFAPTPSLAILGARQAERINVLFVPDNFISLLPIEALEPPAEILSILALWGIRATGQFLALGRSAIAERLGVAGLEMFEKVSLSHTRPLKLVLPPDQFVERMEFEHEIETADPLLFVLRRFIEQLSRRIASAHRVIAEMQLNLNLSNGERFQNPFKIPQPTCDIETLFLALRTFLETFRTESPINAVELRATPVEINTRQLGFFEITVKNPNQFAETLARLAALCGHDHVGTPVPLSTYRPDAFKMAAPDYAAIPSEQPPGEAQSGPQLRRFRPPRPATIEFSEGRPVSLRQAAMHSPIQKVRGPFLSSGDWWDRGRWARQEWDVETSDGSLVRIFQSGEGCFVEGVYD
jgi:protein ImuB